MASALSRHNGWFIALVIFNCLTLIAVFIFSGLSSQGYYPMFLSTQSLQAHDRYTLDITPAGWLFYAVWTIIYVWQVLWLAYSVVNLFRTNNQKESVYSSPYILPPLMYGIYSVANGLNIAWIVLFDRNHIEAAFAVLMLLSLLLMLALGIAYRALDSGLKELALQDRTKDAHLTRALVHNGLAVYATWTQIAALINLAVVISYVTISDVTTSRSSRIALGILAAEIVLLSFVDLFFLDRYSRYTFTPYGMVVLAMAGVLTGSGWSEGENIAGEVTYTLAIAICAFSALVLVVKVIVAVVRTLRQKP